MMVSLVTEWGMDYNEPTCHWSNPQLKTQHSVVRQHTDGWNTRLRLAMAGDTLGSSQTPMHPCSQKVHSERFFRVSSNLDNVILLEAIETLCWDRP